MTGTDDDDGLLALYNRRLIELAGQAETPEELPQATLRAHAVSPICGSEVDVALFLDDAGRIRAFGFSVEACALTRAVVGVLKKAVIGKTRDEIAQAGQRLEKMLTDAEAPLPRGDFADLAVLLPVRDYKSRHNAILLPFEAIEKAFAKTPPA